jgi:hypothetical protein
MPIRLFCDLAARNEALIDLNTGQSPIFYSGDDVEIDIGIGAGGALLAPPLSNAASVTCQVFAGTDETNAPLMSSTAAGAAMNLTLTAEQWAGGTAACCHAAFVFANAQTGISLAGAAAQNCRLRITLQTADAEAKVMTLLDGAITVLAGPASAEAPGAGNARFTTDAGGNWVLQIRNDSDGKFYSVGIENDNGMPALYLGDTAY